MYNWVIISNVKTLWWLASLHLNVLVWCQCVWKCPDKLLNLSSDLSLSTVGVYSSRVHENFFFIRCQSAELHVRSFSPPVDTVSRSRRLTVMMERSSLWMRRTDHADYEFTLEVLLWDCGQILSCGKKHQMNVWCVKYHAHISAAVLPVTSIGWWISSEPYFFTME